MKKWYCDDPPVGRTRWLRGDVVHVVGKPEQQSQHCGHSGEKQWQSVKVPGMKKDLQIAWFGLRNEKDCLVWLGLDCLVWIGLDCLVWLGLELPGLANVRNVETSSHRPQLPPPILRSETSEA